MPTSLILEPDNDADLQLLLQLARRLGVKATVVPGLDARSEAEREESFYNLFGAWKSDESDDELVKQIYEARTNNDRRDAEIEALMNGSYSNLSEPAE